MKKKEKLKNIIKSKRGNVCSDEGVLIKEFNCFLTHNPPWKGNPQWRPDPELTHQNWTTLYDDEDGNPMTKMDYCLDWTDSENVGIGPCDTWLA